MPGSVLPADAAAVLYDTLVRFIRDGLRVLLVVGLIVAIAAFFSGPSVTAVRTRGAVKSGFNWVRARGERAGVSTGPVGQWTYTHRRALRITAVAIAALIFVFWGQPTVTVVVVIGLMAVLQRHFLNRVQPAWDDATLARDLRLDAGQLDRAQRVLDAVRHLPVRVSRPAPIGHHWWRALTRS